MCEANYWRCAIRFPKAPLVISDSCPGFDVYPGIKEQAAEEVIAGLMEINERLSRMIGRPYDFSVTFWPEEISHEDDNQKREACNCSGHKDRTAVYGNDLG